MRWGGGEELSLLTTDSWKANVGLSFYSKWEHPASGSFVLLSSWCRTIGGWFPPPFLTVPLAEWAFLSKTGFKIQFSFRSFCWLTWLLVIAPVLLECLHSSGYESAAVLQQIFFLKGVAKHCGGEKRHSVALTVAFIAHFLTVAWIMHLHHWKHCIWEDVMWFDLHWCCNQKVAYQPQTLAPYLLLRY